MKVCRACGSEVGEGRDFCPHCGTAEAAGPASGKGAGTGGVPASPGKKDGLCSVPAIRGALPARADPVLPADKDDVLFCPVCRTTYPASVSYCEADGTPLERIVKYIMPTLTGGESGPEGDARGDGGVRAIDVLSKDGAKAATGMADAMGSGKKEGFRALRLVVPGAALLVALVAGYFYFSGYFAGAGRMEAELNAALRARGVDVTAKVGGDRSVTVTGNVSSKADRDAVLAIVKSHRDASVITENIRITASGIETERALNEALDGMGLTGVEARVDSDFQVLLTGIVRDEREKVLALKTVKADPDVRGVQDNLRIKRESPGEKADKPEGAFTEVRHFRLSPLSPSSWASLKYRDSFTFKVPGPGRIAVEAAWEPEGSLALTLNSTDSGTTKSEKDGTSPLKLSYRVSPGDFAKGSMWEATIANFSEKGPRAGVLKVIFVGPQGDPGKAAPAKDAGFDTRKLEGEINQALKDGGIQGVSAEVDGDRVAVLKGSVKTQEEKQKAFEIAKRFKLVKTVKDIIFVVGS